MKASRKVRTLIIALAVCGVAVAAAVVAARIALRPDKIKSLVLPPLEQALGRSVDFSSVGISLYPVLGVLVERVTVQNTGREGFTSGAFLEVGTLRAGVRVLPLFRRQVDITRIVIADAFVLVESDTSGAWNYDDLAFLEPVEHDDVDSTPRAGPFLPLPVTLERLTVRNLRLVYHDRKSRQRLALGSVSQELELAIDTHLRDIRSSGWLRINDIDIAAGEIPEPIEGLRVSLAHRVVVDLITGRAQIDSLAFSLQEFALQLRGSIDSLFHQPVYDLVMEVPRTPLATILDQVPPALFPYGEHLRVGGVFTLTGTISGKGDSTGIPAVAGEVMLEQGSVQYAGFPRAIEDIEAAVAYTLNSAVIRTLRMRAGGDVVELRGAVTDFSGPALDVQLKAQVNLGTVGDLFPLPDDTRMAGKVTADLGVRGVVDAADPGRLDATGTVTLSGVAITTPAVTKPVQMDGTVRLTSADIVVSLASRIGSSSLDCRGTLRNYLPLLLPDGKGSSVRSDLTFTIDAPVLNTDEFLPQPVPVPPGSPSSPRSSDPGAILVLAAPLPGVDVNGEVRSGRIVWQGIELSSVKGSFRSRNDEITIDASAGAFGGRMRQLLVVDARRHDNLAVRSTITASGVDIGAFVSDMAGLLPQDQALFVRLQDMREHLSGQTSMTARATTSGGSVNQLVANVAARVESRIENGEVGGAGVEELLAAARRFKVVELDRNRLPFRTFTMNLDVRDEQVFFTDVSAQSAVAGDLALGGSVGFDSRLDGRLSWRHARTHSAAMLQAQNQVRGALQGHLGGTAGALLGTLELIPSDREGRVTSLWSWNCLVADIKAPAFGGFAAGDGTGSRAQPAREQITERAREAVRTEAARQIEKGVDAAREKGEEVLKPLKDALPKEVNDDVKDAARDAAKRLKKLF